MVFSSLSLSLSFETTHDPGSLRVSDETENFLALLRFLGNLFIADFPDFKDRGQNREDGGGVDVNPHVLFAQYGNWPPVERWRHAGVFLELGAPNNLAISEKRHGHRSAGQTSEYNKKKRKKEDQQFI